MIDNVSLKDIAYRTRCASFISVVVTWKSFSLPCDHGRIKTDIPGQVIHWSLS